MTCSKPYHTASYVRAVAALQTLPIEEGPAQLYRARGIAPYMHRDTLTNPEPPQGQLNVLWRKEPHDFRNLSTVRPGLAAAPGRASTAGS